MSNADIRGRFVWHELMTTDTKAAGAFYPRVTGWKTQAWDKDPTYMMWVGAKGPFGGLRTLPDATRAAGSNWLAYIGIPDVDAGLQTAQRLGARVLMGATDIPGSGRFAVLADPQGASFAIFSPPPSPDQSGSGSMPQEFSWHELASTDAVAALRFYGELFGWTEVDKHDMGPMGFYHLVGIGGVASIGFFKISAEKPMSPRWMCYAHVTDIDKSANAARAAGGKLVQGPMEVPGGTWIAHIIDPQGAALALHADRRIAAAAPAAQPPKVAAPTSVASPPASKPRPPSVSAAAPTAPSAAPAKPKVAAAVSAPPKAPAASKPAAKKAPAKKTAAKKASAKKSVAKKKKKASAKKRPQRKSKSAARRSKGKASAKRKSVKKRAKTRGRRTASGFAVARRFAAKQADSLLKRLRGKKRRHK